MALRWWRWFARRCLPLEAEVHGTGVFDPPARAFGNDCFTNRQEEATATIHSHGTVEPILESMVDGQATSPERKIP
jgi:hypothetical protein